MKHTIFVLLLIVLSSTVAHAESQIGTGFTYQGNLVLGTSKVSGSYNFQFALFDGPSSSNQIGVTLTQTNVPVTNGLFTTIIDFGNAPYTNGAALWLSISVCSNGDGEQFTALWPRQQITASPFALYAINSSQTIVSTTNLIPSSQITGLGMMALQPTNSPSYWDGTNRGAFTLAESSGYWGSGGNDEHLVFWDGADIWYNFGHSVEPEWQFGTQGSVSWTIGEDGQGKAVNHFGGSGAYHSLWYFQYDDANDYTRGGHSTPFGWALHLNNNGNQNHFAFGYWMAEQVDTNTPAYRLNFHYWGGRPSVGATGFNQTEFMGNDYVAGGLGSNTLFWTGAEFTNTVTHGNTSATSTGTNIIDFSYVGTDCPVITAGASLTLLQTNLSYTNKTVIKDITLHNSKLGSVRLALPTNWLALTTGTAAGNNLPTNIPNGNDMILHVIASCGFVTNVYVSFQYAWNPPVVDTNAAQFLSALVSGGYSPTVNESNAINDFVLTGKTQGWWSGLALFYPQIGATSNSCRLNLVNPGVGAITWHSPNATNFTSKGVYGTSSRNFFGDTGWAFTSLSSINSAGYGFYGEQNPSGNTRFMGVEGPTYNILGRSGNSLQVYGVNTTDNFVVGTSPTATWVGFLAYNRSASNVAQAYNQAGISGGVDTNTPVAFPTAHLYLFGDDASGSLSQPTDAGVAFFAVWQNLQDSDVRNLSAAMTNLAAALGR